MSTSPKKAEPSIGRPVLVDGIAGSGKSIFSRALSARTGFARHPSRRSLLEAGLGEAIGA
jgi:hypothetical protein